MKFESMQCVSRRRQGTVLALSIAAGLVLSSYVPSALAESAGMIKTSKGVANIHRQGQFMRAEVGVPVQSGDRIETGADGAVGIMLRDNTSLTTGPNSTMDLNRFAFDTTTHAGVLNASVKRGTLAVISGKIAKANPDKVAFTTPMMTLGVRGTAFVIDAGASGE